MDPICSLRDPPKHKFPYDLVLFCVPTDIHDNLFDDSLTIPLLSPDMGQQQLYSSLKWLMQVPQARTTAQHA